MSPRYRIGPVHLLLQLVFSLLLIQPPSTNITQCQSHLALPFSRWSKSTTCRRLLLHLKQATLSLCASASSHLLSWHRAHTCRLTTSSHCVLIPAKPGPHPKHTRVTIQASLVWRGLIERRGQAEIRSLPGGATTEGLVI